MSDLESLRREIEQMDDEIVSLLGARFAIVKRISELKARDKLPVVVPERIAEVKQRAADKGADYDLDPAFIKRLYQLIIDEAVAQEEKLTKGGGASRRWDGP